MWLEAATSSDSDESLLEKGIMEGENPVHHWMFTVYGSDSNESRSLGLERKRVVDSI